MSRELTKVYLVAGDKAQVLVGYFFSGVVARAAQEDWKAVGHQTYTATYRLTQVAPETVREDEVDRRHHFVGDVDPAKLGELQLAWLSLGADSCVVDRFKCDTYERPDGTVGGVAEPQTVVRLTVKAPVSA